MVQVVPALPQSDQRHKAIVAAGITGGKRLIPKQMGQGIDTGHPMEQQGGAEKKCGQPSHAAQLPRKAGQQEHWHEMEPIDQPHHRIGLHIGGQGVGEEAWAKQPANLGTPKPPPAC